jgi:uncharacterized protein YdhG (YjbR/CyaY superfamily)
MISAAKNVTEYLKQAPEERRAVLTNLRNLCRDILVGYEEVMEYGIPGYKKDKGVEISFASQKNYVGFYCLVHEVMLANKHLLKGLDHGKGVIRFSKPDKIDLELIRKILTDTVNSGKKPC